MSNQIPKQREWWELQVTVRPGKVEGIDVFVAFEARAGRVLRAVATERIVQSLEAGLDPSPQDLYLSELSAQRFRLEDPRSIFGIGERLEAYAGSTDAVVLEKEVFCPEDLLGQLPQMVAERKVLGADAALLAPEFLQERAEFC